MEFDFDRIIDRSGTSSSKWEKYPGGDVLPFWVADMEFATPGFIRDAVAERLSHEVIGYTRTPPQLVEAFVGWLWRHYGWTVPEEWLVWIPGVVPGVNLTARAVAEPGGAILIPTPVYYPFLSVPGNADQAGLKVPLTKAGRRWVMDFDALQAAVDGWTGGRPRLLLLANPQNPTGRAYDRSELTALADFCLANDLVLCSDEIHSAILIDPDVRHLPIASLSPEIAEKTVSLFAATKTYNIPGLPCAVAVIPDRELRRAFNRARAGLVPDIGPLGYAASRAAFADTSGYLPELLDYLRGNHARLAEVAGSRMTPVEATYLGWIDLTDTAAAPAAGAYFERFGLGLSDGGPFDGPGFVRFNFACPRSLLERGLDRLAAGLDALR
ncbi:MAG TPA: PatB family C-S lyase [Pseudomonadales bacterium]